MSNATLAGFTVGVTADRRADDQAELLRRRGARVQMGASIGTAYLGDEDALHTATVELIARPPDVFVANTGVGMRSWFDAAQAWGLVDELVAALSGAHILARGPKAAAQAQMAGLEVHGRATTERLSEVEDQLLSRQLSGRRVAVQLHGDETSPFTARVLEAGAQLVLVPVYQWRFPEDLEPARRLVEAVVAGSLDAITFTSAPAARNLVAIAEPLGLADRLLAACHERVLVACVGPVCSDAARAVGFTTNVFPALGRMGRLVRVLEDHLRVRSRSFQLRGREAVLQGSTLFVGGQVIELSAGERALLRALTDAPGRVVGKDDLQMAIWGEVASSHRLHVAMARLRSRLGEHGEAVEPVYGRGYRLVR